MIQYYHHNKSFFRKTVALEVPQKDILMEMLKLGQRNIRLNIGQANVHPKDQYVRKTGRLISTQNIKETLYQLSSVRFKDDHMLFILKKYNEDDFAPIVLLKVFYDRPKVHFLEG